MAQFDNCFKDNFGQNIIFPFQIAKGGTRGDTEWSQWVWAEKEQLAYVMERHGIEWEDKGTHDQHLSVLNYKKEQRVREVAALDAEAWVGKMNNIREAAVGIVNAEIIFA